MSIQRCSRLYQPLHLNINSWFVIGNNSRNSLRQYTSLTPVLYQKDPRRFDQHQHKQKPTTFNATKKKLIKPRFRPGDWICPQCNFHNHARRSKCAECTTKADTSLRKAQHGDWICPHCEYYNFRQRLSCKQCEELRPSPSELLQKYQQQNQQD